MPTVVFICTANRYRSPLAAAMFQKCLQADGNVVEWKVASAGVWTIIGQPALLSVVRLAEKMGMTLHSHLSRPVDADLLSQADLIIAMEAGQREALLAEFPQVEGRVFLLSEVAVGITYDIPDLLDDKGNPTLELGNEVCSLVELGYKNICQLALRLSVESPSGR